MKITFMGATETVTGSRYLIEHEGKKILIDCGLFQGHKELRLRNWEPFPVDPKSLSAVILTHAHLDHTGYLPRLVKSGFRGKIFCSPPTEALANILLPDSGHLQEEDARHYNKWHVTKHKPALPLYTEEEARQSLKQFQSIAFGKNKMLFDDCSFILHRMGHILGAASVTIKDENTSILFSGDIGRMNDPIMNPPAQIKNADYIVVESTYGNRRHLDEQDPLVYLEKIINKTIHRGGVIIVPAFAVGRAQTLLYYIWKLKMAKRIPADLPVFLDSPMAIDASQLFCQYSNEHKLSHQQAKIVCEVAKYIQTPEQSKVLDQLNKPMIIISASGMVTGGRVLHHIKNFVGDAKNTILFTGYQASGTRGDKMIRGVGEIKIFGQVYPIKAEIQQLNNMSAHADYEEIIEWLSYFQKPPRKVFITHGEMESAKAMKKIIEDRLGWPCIIPEFMHAEEL